MTPRDVSPELWRPIGPFIDDKSLLDLKRVLDTGTLLERQAATLTLRACANPQAKALLGTVAELSESAENRQFTWSTLSREWLSLQRG